MKAVLVLAVAASVAAQYYQRGSQGVHGFVAPYGGGFSPIISYGGRGGGSGLSHGGYGGGSVISQGGHGGGSVISQGGHGGGSVISHGGYGGGSVISHGGHGAQVDYSAHGSDYHFSWRHDGGQKYEWDGANKYCSSLGYGWQGISIESRQEDKFVDSIIAGDKVKYIWTGGYRNGYEWQWPSGAQFYGLDWSHTGGDGQPQPDNREDGKEFCLAVLNHFYQDGITWHDVACHHLKPIICERRRTYG